MTAVRRGGRRALLAGVKEDLVPVDMQTRDGTAVLTLNRPKALNAMSPELLDELDRRLDEVVASEDVRCVILTGAGPKAFCAGADITAFQGLGAVEARAYALRGHAVARRIEELPTPVIAAVNGYALGGGCEMALACDFRVASEGAVFGQPEVKLGIPPGWGGTQRLARATNPGFAKEMILTGRNVDAETALRVGLVNHVFPADELLERTMELAAAIAGGPTWAIGAAKELCNLAMGSDLAAALAREADVFGVAFATPDQREGVSAFLEKRDPDFAR